MRASSTPSSTTASSSRRGGRGTGRRGLAGRDGSEATSRSGGRAEPPRGPHTTSRSGRRRLPRALEATRRPAHQRPRLRGASRCACVRPAAEGAGRAGGAAGRGGAVPRGLARVSVGPRERGGRLPGPGRPPPGVGPAVGGAPWRLAGGSRGGCGGIGGGRSVVEPRGRIKAQRARPPPPRTLAAAQTLLALLGWQWSRLGPQGRRPGQAAAPC